MAIKSKVIKKVEMWHNMTVLVVFRVDRIEMSMVVNMFEIVEVLVVVFMG